MHTVLLWWTVVVSVYGAAAPPMSHMSVNRIQDYNGPSLESAWITIRVHPDLTREFHNRVPKITRVLWCRSLEPNPAPPNLHVNGAGVNLLEPPHDAPPQPADIDECRAPNLLRMQLYPNSNVEIRQTKDEPDMLYIDPDQLGGRDTTHQFDIIVEMRMNDSATGRYVVRFNPITPPVVVVVETTPLPVTTQEEVETPPPPPPTETPEVAIPTTMETPVVVETPAAAVAIAIPTTMETPLVVETPAAVMMETVHRRKEHPWAGVIIVFTSGVCFIAVIGLVLRYGSNVKQRILDNIAKSRFSRVSSHNPTDVYEFAHGSDEVDMFTMNDAQEAENNRRILLLMGNGATPAFDTSLLPAK